jgi:hypothetical protein
MVLNMHLMTKILDTPGTSETCNVISYYINYTAEFLQTQLCRSVKGFKEISPICMMTGFDAGFLILIRKCGIYWRE